MQDSNTHIRKAMCQRRAALSVWQRQQAARALVLNTLRAPIFHHAQHIAVYLAVKGEADPQSLVPHAWQQGKQVYLPVLSSLRPGYLQFARWHKKTALIANRFGILEPVVKPKELIAVKRLDMVLMPLTAYDVQGNRLGMGGGYYDRSFAFLQRAHHRYQHKPYLLGCAYEFQQSSEIQAQAWDVPLAAVVTEKSMRKFY